jgi:transglutaminase-like putative cysteine protease
MSFESLYRISFYAMLFLATLALSVDVARDNPLAPLYPMAVAVAGVVAFLTVDRNPRFGLPRELSSLLGFASIALCLFEWNRDRNQLVLALGHWLVYLQIIMMFLPKTVEDDWFLFLLALTQVVVGAFQPGENVGMVLILWALVALWTLRLFHLRREASQSDQIDPLDPYPGLVDRTFVLSAFNVALLTLVLGGLIFLVMPRWSADRGRRFRPQVMAQHLTGFSDSVRLGQMGEILENDTIVMSVELFDEEGRSIEPPTEPLWRGVTLVTYQSGRWTRGDAGALEFDNPNVLRARPSRPILQRIKLEPSDTDVLFGLRPITYARGPDLGLNVYDGAIYRLDMRPSKAYVLPGNRHPGAYDYEVESDADAGAIQPHEIYPSERRLQHVLLEVPESLREPLQAMNAQVLRGVRPDPVAQAEALERYLRDGEFRYTLVQSVVDPSIDPVEDFLVNRKQGHCEYFASALALLLRSAGIPARMVNGFKGGDWNTLAQLYYVRQKHAHSWVEALVGQDREGHPIWKTLDPTPPAERDETVAQIGPSGRFRTVSDFFRYLWVFYVVGFDAARQERLIYGPIRGLFQEAGRGFAMMGRWLRMAARWLLDFRSLSAFFSVRGFVVSVVVLLLLAGLARLVRWLARRLGWGRRAGDDSDPMMASGVAPYRRLLQLLAAIGLKRPPAETPREFARRASDVLAARGPETTVLAGVPASVVEAFYRVRYGRRPLSSPEAESIDARLDALEDSLRPQ